MQKQPNRKFSAGKLALGVAVVGIVAAPLAVAGSALAHPVPDPTTDTSLLILLARDRAQPAAAVIAESATESLQITATSASSSLLPVESAPQLVIVLSVLSGGLIVAGGAVLSRNNRRI